MQNPLQITFHNVDRSDAVEQKIQEKVAQLEHFFDAIVGCHITVESQHRHHRKGVIYHIKIHLMLPGSDIVVGREPERNHAHEDIYVAIRDAFDTAKRLLEAAVRRMRREIKNRKAPERRLLAERGA
jgi:ribosomal subunit interface protein